MVTNIPESQWLCNNYVCFLLRHCMVGYSKSLRDLAEGTSMLTCFYNDSSRVQRCGKSSTLELRSPARQCFTSHLLLLHWPKPITWPYLNQVGGEARSYVPEKRTGSLSAFLTPTIRGTGQRGAWAECSSDLAGLACLVL